MKSKKIQNIILFFSGINILFLGVYGALYYFINQKNKETAEIYSSLYRKVSEKDDLSSLERSLTNSTEKRAILESYFVRQEGAVAFIEQIENLGGYAGVDLKLNSVTPPKKTTDEFLVDFSATGKFENMYKLFALVDEIPYRVYIKKAALSVLKSDQKNAAPLWSGNFTIVLESYLEH